MNSAVNLHHANTSTDEMFFPNNTYNVFTNFSEKNEQKILKIYLLGQLRQLFCELFHNHIKNDENSSSMEHYIMDKKIIQLLIHDIIETEEYTLEGIAYHTHIPFDVLYDAACGINNQLSITPWIKVVDLYMQVKPNVAQALIDKLLEVKNNSYSNLSALLK